MNAQNFCREHLRLRRFRSAPRRAHFDPLGQRGDLRVLQFAGRRHAQRFGMADRAQQQAFGGLTRHDRRTARAAFEHGFATVQPESTHGGSRGRMTRLTLLRQHRPNVFLEEFRAILSNG